MPVGSDPLPGSEIAGFRLEESLGGSPLRRFIVIYPDNDTLRMLVQERHAQLARDALQPDS